MKNLNFTLLALCISVFVSAQQTITVNVPNAGGLSAALLSAGGNKATVTNLTITGNIDARDFRFMRDSMQVVSFVDLESVTIDEYIGSDGTYTDLFYQANEIPCFAFCFPVKPYIGKHSLIEIKFPKNLTSINDMAFYGCKYLKIATILPKSLVKIGINSFYNCNTLPSSIYFPNSLNMINQEAFVGCNINRIFINNSTPITSNLDLGINKSTCELIVPVGSKLEYQQATYWSEFENISEAIFLVIGSSEVISVSPISPTLITKSNF